MFVLSLAGYALSQAAPATGVAAQVRAMLEKTKGEIKRVTAADVKAAIDTKEKAVILDVRDPEEFAAGRLPGAINVTRGKLEFRIAAAVPDLNTKIYVYCLTAARSAFATKTLNDLGYKNAVQMDESLEAWIKAGFPIVR
jgi:rhodanese-related sulfurtransferase